MITKRAKWIIAIVMLVLMGIGKLCLSRSNPRDTFEYLVTKPIPQSVTSIQEGSFRAMDSVLRVLRFQIASQDLHTILQSQGYKPIGQEQLWGHGPEGYFLFWEERIRATKLEVHFAKDTQGYMLDEGRGQKYIFCTTNAPDVVFIADAH